ncbi:MAG: hypothetical protein PHE88_04990 [Elusimicrobia bacterium]|nr:hypothetical protein [Elusimicrobiota bacterium]
MDKKIISYVGFGVGIVLILIGSWLLYLKERNVKKPVLQTTATGESFSQLSDKQSGKIRKVEVVIATPTATSSKSDRFANSNVPTSVKPETVVNNANGSDKLQKRKIIFRYRSSKPKNVFLIGDFNKWDKKANPMKKGVNFFWEAMVLLSPGEYKYAFLVDGKQINDQYNKRTLHLKSGKASLLTIKPLQ